MQRQSDQISSPLLKHGLSPQMSRSHMERNHYNTSLNTPFETSASTRKIELLSMREKILDVEKMIKNRDRQFLSPSFLRGSIGTNTPTPEPKLTRPPPIQVPTITKIHFNKEELRSSWNDHLLNMFENSQMWGGQPEKAEPATTTTIKKNLAPKMNLSQSVNPQYQQASLKYIASQRNSPRDEWEQGQKNMDDSPSYRYRIVKEAITPTPTTANDKLRSSRPVLQLKPVTGNQNQNIDKIRLHINRSMEVLDLIKKDPAKQKDPRRRSKILQPTKMINGFEIGPALGKGKFGMVYLARHRETGFIAAIKKIEKSKIKQFNLIVQFGKEIRLHSSLDHPQIVKFYGFFQEEKEVYLTLQYMNGGTLFNLLNKVGILGIKQTVDFLRDIILAVDYLHERSIAHRDIKPQNIVISTQGMGKLCDFGWASVVDSVRNTYCGTLDYASPEILERKDYGLAVDVWSIGILAYQMLMGKAPFEDKNRNIVKERILNVDNIEFSYANNVPQEAREFIEALVQKDATKRPRIGELLNFRLFANYGSRASRKPY